jgi:hypothetical protein
MQNRKPQPKIHRVIIGDRDFFIYAITKQGAVRDVLEFLKQGALCRVATGEDMYNLGVAGGTVLGTPASPKDDQPDLFVAGVEAGPQSEAV